MSKYFFIFLLLIMLLSACSDPIPASSDTLPISSTKDETQSTTSVQATITPLILTATSIPEPTLTPTKELSPTPDGQYFRDDFTSSFSSDWTIDYESLLRRKITDNGMLRIVAENSSLLTDEKQSNLFWHNLPEGDFDISVHLIANPTEDFQQAAIFIYQDRNNYVTINRGMCSPCGGSGFFMDYKISGAFGTYKSFTQKSDVYLKLERKADKITGYYATEPDEWVRMGFVGNAFEFKKAGLGVSNCGSPKSNLIAEYDWFEINKITE
jgi:hypothetical protein